MQKIFYFEGTTWILLWEDRATVLMSSCRLNWDVPIETATDGIRMPD